jgi:hypothetical protein
MNVLIRGAAFAGFVGVSLRLERHARQLVARVPAPATGCLLPLGGLAGLLVGRVARQ